MLGVSTSASGRSFVRTRHGVSARRREPLFATMTDPTTTWQLVLLEFCRHNFDDRRIGQHPRLDGIRECRLR
jgi:hypothetical protein